MAKGEGHSDGCTAKLGSKASVQCKVKVNILVKTKRYQIQVKHYMIVMVDSAVVSSGDVPPVLRLLI